MYYFVFIWIVLIVKCEAGEWSMKGNPSALLINLSSSDPVNAVYYTAVINIPLDIPFQDVFVTNGVCYDLYEIVSILEASISNSVIHVNNVTHSMSTMWECVLFVYRPDYKNYMDLESRMLSLYLNLHVKGAKSVQMSVNGKELTFGEVDLSVPYDGDTNYFFEDGEHVEIVCKNPHSTGSVHLKYFSKDANIKSDSAEFSIQLHPTNHSSYIDCVYNSTEPADTYVYRVTFVIKKRLTYLNGSRTPSNVKISAKSSSLILGSSVGAVLIFLGLTGAVCWCVRTRNAKQIKTPFGILTHQNGSRTPQAKYTNEYENQYDACHYSEILSNRETYYETPGSAEDNVDPKDNYYTKVDYSRCKPKIGESQTTNSQVYDEPYVQITMGDRM